jgi:hypothetical protein
MKEYFCNCNTVTLKDTVVGFDLSAAFDTVGREDLLPKMEAMGIRGKSLKWFRLYLTNARQRVVWDGQVTDVVDVEYCVRQGSLLGPVLYLLHVSDLPLTLEIRESDGDSGYADDKAVTVVAEDHEEARLELQRLVNVMVDYMKTNGLALNGSKTQAMVGGKGKYSQTAPCQAASGRRGRPRSTGPSSPTRPCPSPPYFLS